MSMSGNELLEDILAESRNLIDGGHYDSALMKLRTVAHHVSMWLVYKSGLWREACDLKDNNPPDFDSCVQILQKRKVINTETRLMLVAVREYGNLGVHEGKGSKEDAEYLYGKLKPYAMSFLMIYPDASRLGVPAKGGEYQRTSFSGNKQQDKRKNPSAKNNGTSKGIDKNKPANKKSSPK